jgi:hypothetical protein
MAALFGMTNRKRLRREMHLNTPIVQSRQLNASPDATQLRVLQAGGQKMFDLSWKFGQACDMV